MEFEKNDFRNKSIKKYFAEKKSGGDDDFSELQEFLFSLVSIFEYSDAGIPLFLIIQKDWKLFSSEDSCKNVLNNIIQLDSTSFEKYGIKNSTSTVSYKESITDCIAVWDELKDDIKNHHRFTTDLKKLADAGWDKILDNQYQIRPDMSLYRARIHYKKADKFGVGDMGAPKKEECKSGRANPEGIPFLYLSEETRTTLYETRVIKHDVVTVGEFKVEGTDPLYVENLTDIDLDEIELLDEDVVTLAKRKLLFRALSNDMSHPIRRFDSLVEYVPTQFLCEYVQLTQAVLGIRFSSSVYPKGTNVVIFDPKKMRCVAVQDYNIEDLDIAEKVV